MSIRLKLSGVLLLLLLPLVLTGVLSYRTLDRAGQVSAELTAGIGESRQLTNVRGATNSLSLSVSRALLAGRVPAQDAAVDAARLKAETLVAGLPDSAALTPVRTGWSGYGDALRAVLAAPPAQARSLFESSLERERAGIVSSVNGYLDGRERTLNLLEGTLARELAAGQRWVLITLLLGGAAGTGAAFLLMRRVSDAVRDVARVSQRLADGHLDDVRVNGSADEVGQMLRALSALTVQQRALAGTMVDISRGVSDTSFPVRHGADVLGQAVHDLTRHTLEVARAADAVSQGDLTTVPPVRSDADTLGQALRAMVEQLRAFVHQNQQVGSELAQASQSLVTATTQQATSVNQQSAAIAETTAAVEEVRTSSRHAVEVAGSVARRSDEARSVAAQGVDATRDAEAGMTELQARVDVIAQNMLQLSRQSRQIGEIIETVSELADQSNLLALNAAIEANRAGEQGRGFAVVAQEIRTLAEQSKGATAQIRRKLEDMQTATNAAVLATEEGSKQAQVGSALIGRAGQTIVALSDVNEDASRMASQIADAVQQHALSMEQIAIAMNDINDATLQHLNVTQDNQQVARHLQTLLERLTTLTGRYRT